MISIKFGVFIKQWQQLNYVEKNSTRIPVTLRMIPPEVIDQLTTISLRVPETVS